MFLITSTTIRHSIEGEISSSIPLGIYEMCEDQNEAFLIKQDMSPLPKKLYGVSEKNADRIISTFIKRNANTGVLLNGEKGSGKTLLTKLVAHKVKDKYPIIMINKHINVEKLTYFISSLRNSCVILFDEFEKMFSNDDQEGLLSLFDGLLTSNHLFIFTTNLSRYLIDQFQNRPGRIYYCFEFGGLKESFVIEYCNENLNNKEYLDDVIKISNSVSKFNFDMLSAIVAESNMYDENPKEFIDFINVKPSSNREYSKLELYFGDNLIYKDDSYSHEISSEIIIYGSYLETKKGHKLKNDDCITFNPNNIVNIEKNIITYQLDNYKCIITKKEENKFYLSSI